MYLYSYCICIHTLGALEVPHTGFGVGGLLSLPWCQELAIDPAFQLLTATRTPDCAFVATVS